jgi:L-alanine-DL-glutamate epimerase-like enolase superfamily enzyme
VRRALHPLVLEPAEAAVELVAEVHPGQYGRRVPSYAALADLPLRIDGYALDGLVLDVSSGFTRRTTVIRLRGAGEEGVGEDVTYDADEQLALQQRHANGLPLAGEHTLDSFSRLVGGLDLFPELPADHVFRSYRRWGFESAALDLALRQAGRSLAAALGREPRPVVYVVSTRATDLKPLLALYPELRFKLDPTPEWTDALVAELAATGAVDVADLKGAYVGTPVDNPPSAELYRRVAEGFPDAWIEDPALTPETDEVLRAHRDRITWDAVIHSVADVEALPFPPRCLNVKPSRFGSLRALLDFYDHCEANGIALYGGGQFELGPGRGQIQYLASLFHPSTGNDVSPVEFHGGEPPRDAPRSPLRPPDAAEPGFRYDARSA